MHVFAGHEHEHLHENVTAFDSKAQAIALNWCIEIIDKYRRDKE